MLLGFVCFGFVCLGALGLCRRSHVCMFECLLVRVFGVSCGRVVFTCPCVFLRLCVIVCLVGF